MKPSAVLPDAGAKHIKNAKEAIDMTQTQRAIPLFRDPDQAFDDEVEAVLAEFDGDPWRAIRALLDDIAILAEDRPRGPRLELLDTRTLHLAPSP